MEESCSKSGVAVSSLAPLRRTHLITICLYWTSFSNRKHHFLMSNAITLGRGSETDRINADDDF